VAETDEGNAGPGPLLSKMVTVIINLIRDNVIRTQISLDKQEYESAKRQAAALGISLAEFIRRAVREHLPAHGQDPWMRYAGFVDSGDPRSSQSIDEIIYGVKD
jgi:hypothetical protein